MKIPRYEEFKEADVQIILNKGMLLTESSFDSTILLSKNNYSSIQPDFRENKVYIDKLRLHNQIETWVKLLIKGIILYPTIESQQMVRIEVKR